MTYVPRRQSSDGLFWLDWFNLYLGLGLNWEDAADMAWSHVKARESTGPDCHPVPTGSAILGAARQLHDGMAPATSPRS